ncbi:tetratricopeptide repeat protein [Sinorhizobium numidicum]|uniref:Tetratricopeptide repeat protein n=1 Tax=Sinorhizobium numidicum TaxID=680248 RepID=A0ABY8CZT8_9HYPH|nr:tetratricopeptide repeat protein [Sinorhizobium numidicum]WEX76988.1 tetratricopeptide repeat protein [Sinorhizobium numidicum]WEX83647.1 tetratricopeptide repeat protein [Sinorhizobium numidicum]
MSAMRFFVILILTCSAVFALSERPGDPLLAAEPSPQTETASVTTPKQRLDGFFAELKKERDEEKAREVADRIRLEWQDSGSATVNLLMQWANKAIADDKHPVALDILDQVIVLAPNYVEGWNRRATLHYQMGNYRKSMSDINRVLAIEPRHFGALAGMAAMLTAAGKDELAMRAWQQFLDIYPSDRKAQEQLGELAEKLAGSRT